MDGRNYRVYSSLHDDLIPAYVEGEYCEWPPTSQSGFAMAICALLFVAIIAGAYGLLWQQRYERPVLVVDRAELPQNEITPNLRFGNTHSHRVVTSLVYLGALVGAGRDAQKNNIRKGLINPRKTR